MLEDEPEAEDELAPLLPLLEEVDEPLPVPLVADVASLGVISVRYGRHWNVSLTVVVMVLPWLLVVVTTLPPPTSPPDVPFVPEPLAVALLLPVPVAMPVVVV